MPLTTCSLAPPATSYGGPTPPTVPHSQRHQPAWGQGMITTYNHAHPQRNNRQCRACIHANRYMSVRHSPGRSAINAPGCSSKLPLACRAPGNTRATPRRTPSSQHVCGGAPLLPAHPTPTPTPKPAVLADRPEAYAAPLTLGHEVSCPPPDPPRNISTQRVTATPSRLGLSPAAL